MSGKSVLRSFSIVALLAMSFGFAANSGSAANYYFDQNGTTAGDGIVNGSTYTWTTNAAATDWSNGSAAGTGPMAAWTTDNTNVPYFGGVTGDVSGWSYNVAVDSTVGNQKGGINVGNVAPGTVTLSSGASTPNFYVGGAVTWTVNNGSTLIDNINSGNGAVNLNNQTLTLAGAGNVTFGSGGSGLDHETSTLTDTLTGVLTLNAAARTSFDTTSTFNWSAGTLALGNAFGLGSAKFNIGVNSSTAGLVLSNVSGGPLTLSSTGAPITINSSFTFAGANNLSFPTAALSTVTLANATPTITVLSNTLIFPQTIVGNAYGINMVGPGTLALNASNTYGGGTTISNGTLAMGANGALGTGGVTVQSGGVLAVTAPVTGPLGNGNVTVQSGGLLAMAAVAGGALNNATLTIQPGGLLDTSALGATGYSVSGGVLTAGRTAGVGTDINGTINLNNSSLSFNGGTAAAGTITVNGGLGLAGGTLSYLAGDQVSLNSAGNLSLTNTSYIVPNSPLSAGTYTVFNNYTGLTGSTGNLAMAGAYGSSPRQTYVLDSSTGTAITLTVSGSAANLQWTGGANSTWDSGVSQNWFNVTAGSADYFYTGDNAAFTDTPGTATTVNVSGSVVPGSVTFSNAAVNYTLSGSGSIGGTTSLQINGPGTLTINNSNTYSGGTLFNGGGLLNIGNAGALGTGPLTIMGGSIDNTSGSAATLTGNNAQNWSGSFTFVGSSPLNMGTGAVALANNPTVTVNAGTLTVGGAMSGASGLTISGTGLFLSTAANSYNGATEINSGTMQLGTGLAGQDGSIGATSSVTNNSALVYDIAGNQTATYKIGGTGTLTKLGQGNLILTAQSTLSGPTSVNGGTLTLQGAGAPGTLGSSPITVASGAYLNLNATDSLGYNLAVPVAVFGTVNKINAQSETLFRPMTLSGGTMYGSAAAAAPNGSWDFEGSGAVISTATGTTNFIAGAGTADIFSVRTATAYFSIGAASTLTISVPIMQNNSGGSSPLLNIEGPGTMVLAGTNYYGTGVNAAAPTVQVGFNSVAGDLALAGSSTFPGTGDGRFQVGYGSTLTITSSAIAFVYSDLKLGSNVSGSSGTANQVGGSLTIADSTSGRPLTIGEYPNETSAYNLSAGALNVPNGWTYLGWNGSGVLNISGGTATLLGINYGGSSQGGALNLSGNGLLSIGGSGIANNGPASIVTFSGGTLQANASWNTSVPMTFNGPAAFNLQGNSIGLSGALSGTGNLAVNGPGTVTLGGSNSYSGGTTVPAGLIVRAANNNALGTGPVYLNGGVVSASGISSYALASPLVLSGGTLGDLVNNGPLSFTAASGTLAQNLTLVVNSPVTIGGGLTDSGSGFTFGKNGPAALTLAGNNTFSGSISVNSGGLYLGGTNATPSIFVASGSTLGGAGSATSAAVTVDNSGVLDLSQNAASTLTFASLAFNNHASINLPVFTSTATLALQAGTLTPNGFSNSVQFNFPQSTIANGTYRLLGYSLIGGSGTAAFNVENLPILGGRQTAGLMFNPNEIDYTVVGFTPYWNGQQQDWRSTNAWTLNPGGSLTTFQFGDNDVFDDSGATGAVGTNVNINQGNVNPISVTFNNATSAYTISGSNGIAGAAFVQIQGGGSLTINNSNGYTGGTQFYAGTLNVNNSSAIGSELLTIAGTAGSTTGGTLGNTSGGPITLSANNAQAWNADFTYGGPFDLNLGTGAVTLSGTRTVNLAAGNLTVGGPIGGSGAALIVTGTGGLVLGGANSYNSGTFILGGTVTAADNNSPLGSGPVSVSPAGGAATLNLTGSAASIGTLTMSPVSGTATLNLTGAAATIGGLSGGAATSAIVLGNAANSSATTLTINNAAPTTFSGTIGDLSQTNSAAVGSLVVNAPGTLTLAGSNTYIGSTTVASGVLQLGSPTALYAGAGAGNAIVNGTLDLNGYNAGVGGLSGTGSVLSSQPGLATLTAGYNNASSTFAGTLQASLAGFTKTGSGVLTLTTATGADAAATTTVNGGTLAFANNNYPTSTTVSTAAGAMLQFNNAGTVDDFVTTQTLNGSGILQKIGAGQLVFEVNWSLGAGALIDVQQGQVTGGNGHLDTWTNDLAALNVATGALFDGVEANVNVDALTGSGTIASGWDTEYTGFTFGVNNGSGTFYGVLADHVHAPVYPGDFIKAGSGTQVLAGTSTYTGSTAINGGVLQLGTGLAGQDGSIATTSGVIDNAALVYDIAGSRVATYNISGSGSVAMIGGGFLQLAGTGNIYYGGTVVNSGTLQLGNAAALGGGGLAADGGTLDLAGFSVTLPSFSGAAGTVTTSVAGLATLGVDQSISTTFGGTIGDGAGQLALNLSGGTLTLSGTNSYSGGTTVSGDAALIVTSPLALDSLGLGTTSLSVGNDLSAFGTVQPASAAAGGVASVPEPCTLALLAAGAGVAIVAVRRGRRIRRLRKR